MGEMIKVYQDMNIGVLMGLSSYGRLAVLFGSQYNFSLKNQKAAFFCFNLCMPYSLNSS